MYTKKQQLFIKYITILIYCGLNTFTYASHTTSTPPAPPAQNMQHANASTPPPPPRQTAPANNAMPPQHHTSSNSQSQAMSKKNLTQKPVGPISILNGTEQDMALRSIDIIYIESNSQSQKRHKSLHLSKPIHLPKKQVTMFNLNIDAHNPPILHRVTHLLTTQGPVNIAENNFNKNQPIHIIHTNNMLKAK